MKLSRTELHCLIWSMQGFKVALLMNISGPGLTKLCRRYNIPLPGRGYWNKKNAGRRVTTISLPDADDDRVILEHVGEELAAVLGSLPKLDVGASDGSLSGDNASYELPESGQAIELRTTGVRRQVPRGRSPAQTAQTRLRKDALDPASGPDKQIPASPGFFSNPGNLGAKDVFVVAGQPINQLTDRGVLRTLPDMTAKFEFVCSMRKIISAAELHLSDLPVPAAEVLKLWLSSTRQQVERDDPVAELLRLCLDSAVEKTLGGR